MYTKHKWNSEKHFNFNYLQYLPKEYDGKSKMPLLIFLHGAGERGDDINILDKHGYMRYIKEDSKEYPFIIISPQCPENKYWACYTESLLAFIDDICQTLSVDLDRVYLTGISMGGTGTWMLAMADPHRFAAIVPICGSGISWYAGSIKHLPIYIYHGDCDPDVPFEESINMLTHINKLGGRAQMKICHNVGHNCWDIAYSDDALVEWFLSHKRENSTI